MKRMYVAVPFRKHNGIHYYKLYVDEELGLLVGSLEAYFEEGKQKLTVTLFGEENCTCNRQYTLFGGDNGRQGTVKERS